MAQIQCSFTYIAASQLLDYQLREVCLCCYEHISTSKLSEMSGDGGNKLALLIEFCVLILWAVKCSANCTLMDTPNDNIRLPLTWRHVDDELLIGERTPSELVVQAIILYPYISDDWAKADILPHICACLGSTHNFSLMYYIYWVDISHDVFDDEYYFLFDSFDVDYTLSLSDDGYEISFDISHDVDDLLDHVGYLVAPSILPTPTCRECYMLQKQKEWSMDPLAPPIPMCMLHLHYTPKCRERIRKQKEQELVPTRQKVTIKNGKKIVNSSPLTANGLVKIATIGTSLLQVLVNCIVWGKCSWFIFYLKHGRAKASNMDLAAALAIFRE